MVSQILSPIPLAFPAKILAEFGTGKPCGKLDAHLSMF